MTKHEILLKAKELYENALAGDKEALEACGYGLCKAFGVIQNDEIYFTPREVVAVPEKRWSKNPVYYWKPYAKAFWPWQKKRALRVRLDAINTALEKYPLQGGQIPEFYQ